MPSDFAELHALYCSNMYPAMVDVLAGQLNVSRKSLLQLGIGWKITDSCWTFPERDADGQIIGIVRRFWNDEKRSEEGSKRGLSYYATRTETGYNASRQTWKRVSEADPCPICGKPDWCGYDDSDPVKFARCMRTSKGSVYEDRGAGYIHELLPGSFKDPIKSGSPLPPSELPVIVVEGTTDVAAAMDLGFVAVGRPSAQGGLGQLVHLLHGRSAAIIGENDAGAGRKGMEKTFEALRGEIPEVIKVLPPSDVKDLRDWIHRYNLTQQDLLQAIEQGNRDSDSNLLESKAPLHIAELWLRTEQTVDGIPILRKYNGEWFRYNGQHYEPLDPDAHIRGRLYAFLKGKMLKKFSTKGECHTEPYETTRSKVTDIMDALNMNCPVFRDPPCWLDEREQPNPIDIVCFSNGILDVRTYAKAGGKLLLPTPYLFSLVSVPYPFDPTAKCPLWLRFLDEIFDGDSARMALLQEWFGYNMVADTSQEKLMLFVGRPASGKSTTLEVLQAVLGHDQYAKSSFKHLCSDFGLQPLMGKLATIMPDAHVPRQVDATQALETIKSIVGRDGVTINRKYLPQLPNCVLPCRFTIAVNELPELPDHARSLERRLNLLHFPVTFEGREDRTLKDRLPQEAAGVAIWALQGLRRLRKQGEFTVPASSGPVLDEFRRFITPVAEFISECCEQGQYTTIKRQMFDAWKAWALDHGLRPGTRSRFGQRFMAQLPTIKSVRLDGTTRPRAYVGIGLLPFAKEKYLGQPGGSQ